MAYTGAGSLIEAWDYNLLTWGGNTTNTYTSTVQNLAYIWGRGFDFYGYGQDASAMTTVSAGGTVSAAQWGTFVQRLNLTLAHQNQTQLASGSNIGITAGATIQYFSNVASSIGTVWTNANTAVSQGSTTTGLAFWSNVSAAAATAYNGVPFILRTVTFASGDAARYFFNAGGQLNLVISNTVNNDGTARSSDFNTLVGTNFGGLTGFKNNTNGGRTGSGGTLNSANGAIGYRQLTTSAATALDYNSSTTSYTGDRYVCYVYSSAQNVSGNGDHGASVILRLDVSSPGHAGFNDTLNVSVNHRVDIVFPETTYLGGSAWGTPTVT
jgi:hypothetical protein